MIYLKAITENSWLIADTEATGNVGILSHNPQDEYFIILGDQKSTFKTKEELDAFFKCDILDTVVSRTLDRDKTNFVDGYPVDLPTIHAVDDVETDLPIYKKTQKSTVIHAAGYYCVECESGWLASYCPKMDTLIKYGYTGPFKTKIQMRSQLSQLKRQ